MLEVKSQTSLFLFRLIKTAWHQLETMVRTTEVRKTLLRMASPVRHGMSRHLISTTTCEYFYSPWKKSSACIWQGLSITWALNDYKNKKWWPFLITCEMCFLKPWFPWFFYCGERKFLLRKHEFLAHCAKSRMVSRKHSYGVCHGYCWWKVIDTNDLCALNTFIDLLTNESWKISK